MIAWTRKRPWIFVRAAVIGFLLFAYKERATHRCQACFSSKSHFQWRIGSWTAQSVPLSRSWERIADSQFSRDFFPPNHVHEWRFAQGSPYSFFGLTWGGCIVGDGRFVSQLFNLYEIDKDFSCFVQTKLQVGTLTRSNFVALVGFQSTGEPSPLQNQADALLKSYWDP